MKKLTAMILCVLLLLGSVCAAAFAQDDAPLYVVLGDSIGYGSGLSNAREACYGRIVADTNGYGYANHAIPGHTTQQLLGRLQEPGVRSDVTAADLISISIGGNNFLLGNIVALLYDGIVREDYSRFDRIAEGFYTDLCTIIETIRDLNPDALLLMQTIYNPQVGDVGAVYQQGADRINAEIRRYDADHPGEIVIVDVAAVLTDSDTDFAADRIHPSVAGNEKIAAEILKTLDAQGIETALTPVINTPGKDIRLPGAFTDVVDLAGRCFRFLANLRAALLRLLPV
ncbi:MAG: hypothetical protein IKD72_11140 [Clostridia bacterium]|nr:hypothetical protein [Clostridia bacterium]